MDALRVGNVIQGMMRAITIQQPFASATIDGSRR
jgi:hypothetical protein